MDSEHSGTKIREQFEALFNPIKDMAKNWDIDLTSILDKYADELSDIQVVFGEKGGGSNVDFTEAAHVIQGTSAVYAKKVEFLYSLTQDVLALISNKKKEAGKKGKGKVGEEDGGDGAERNAEDDDDADLMNLDNIKESNAIDLPKDSAPVRPDQYLMKPMPISLIPLEEFEKCDVPLYNSKGILIGKKDDFRMNTSYVHSTGVLLLDYANANLIPSNPETTFRRRSDEYVIKRPSPIAGYAADAPSPGVAEGSICEDFDGFEAESLEMERAGVSLLDVPGAGNEAEMRGSVSLLKTGRQQPLRSESGLKNASVPPEPDPWEIVDPYEVMGTNKPIKVGRTYVLPKTEAKRQEKERAKRGEDWELTSVYLQNEFYSLKKKLPKEPWRALLWPALEEQYYNKLKEEKSQKFKSRLNRDRAGRLRQREECKEQELKIAEDGVEMEAEEEENMGEQDDGDWELAENDDDDYDIVPIGDAKEEVCFNSDELGYEELVKQGVSKYLKAAQKHMVTTELTKRVQAWEDRIGPALAEEEERRTFDIHEYGTELLEQLGGVGGQKRFADLVAGKPKWEIGRYFLSSLVLANTYNVEISDSRAAPLDSMQLKVLSKERHHEQFSRDV